MEALLNLFVSIVNQPAILVSLAALLELVLQKKKSSDAARGVLKTLVGPLALTGGAGLLVNPLTPFAEIFQIALDTQGVVPSNEVVVATVLQQYGIPTALVMSMGMVVNTLLAHLICFKYIFLTGQAMMYVSCLATVTLVGAGLSVSLPMIPLGGSFEGILLTATLALCQSFMKQIIGNDRAAMGHIRNIDCAASSFIGKVSGDKEKLTGDIKTSKSFGFLKDSIISIMILMSTVYMVLALLAGTGYVEYELSNDENMTVFSSIQAGTFTAGLIVALQGVRMILGEVVPAFQGVAKKLVPNSKPALDVPTISPCTPDVVLIRFFMSFIVGTISTPTMVGLNTTVIMPGIVGYFFCDVAVGVLGSSTGGRQGTVLGAVFNGLLISRSSLFILPVSDGLQLAPPTFVDIDYLIPGLFLGKLGKAGPGLLVEGVIAFVMVVLLASAVLTMRERKVAGEN